MVYYNNRNKERAAETLKGEKDENLWKVLQRQ